MFFLFIHFFQYLFENIQNNFIVNKEIKSVVKINNTFGNHYNQLRCTNGQYNVYMNIRQEFRTIYRNLK